MKQIRLSVTIAAVSILTACSTSRKSAGSPASSQTTKTETPLTTPFPLIKADESFHAPGKQELAAMQIKNKELTLETLNEGYKIYTAGACKNCHGAANIYWYDEARWELLINDMSKRAELTDAQKNAVHSYVLSIKATQPK